MRQKYFLKNSINGTLGAVGRGGSIMCELVCVEWEWLTFLVKSSRLFWASTSLFSKKLAYKLPFVRLENN